MNRRIWKDETKRYGVKSKNKKIDMKYWRDFVVADFLEINILIFVWKFNAYSNG